jgi:hypothetical protein
VFQSDIADCPLAKLFIVESQGECYASRCGYRRRSRVVRYDNRFGTDVVSVWYIFGIVQSTYITGADSLISASSPRSCSTSPSLPEYPPGETGSGLTNGTAWTAPGDGKSSITTASSALRPLAGTVLAGVVSAGLGRPDASANPSWRWLIRRLTSGGSKNKGVAAGSDRGSGTTDAVRLGFGRSGICGGDMSRAGCELTDALLESTSFVGDSSMGWVRLRGFGRLSFGLESGSLADEEAGSCCIGRGGTARGPGGRVASGRASAGRDC